MSATQVLGAMILDNSLVQAYPLDAIDFADHTHSAIYRALSELVDEDSPAGVEGICNRLSAQTGRDYLTDVASIANNATGSANIRVYVKALRRDSRLRRIRAIGAQLASIEDADDADAHISDLLTIGQTQKSHVSDLRSGIREATELMEALSEGKKTGLPTGIDPLDEKLGGLQPSDLIVIAARSQHGKTALMLQVALNQDVPVGLISGEQPNVQLGMRAIAQSGSVSLRDMRIGKVDWDRVDAGVKKLADSKIYTMDKGNPSITEIVGQARQWAHHQGIKALFVDYLQLVSGGGGGEHRLQIGDVVYQLKGLAKELKIPVVALAQVARAIDSAPEGDNYRGRMPYANHLADSAKIEDAADQIITLYRPEVYWPVSHLVGLTYLNICKNRHGATGYVTTHWTGEYVRFGESHA